MKPFEPPPHGQVPRAQRFEITGTIHYRVPGELQWREGITKDVSTTGVLFLADRALKEHTRIEMRLMLPGVKWSEFRVEIACTGRIVREAGHNVGSALHAYGASIATLRFLRRPKPP